MESSCWCPPRLLFCLLSILALILTRFHDNKLSRVKFSPGVPVHVPIGEVREFWFSISWFEGAPAGFRRRLLGINNQFPGPTIRGFYGDLLRVHVTNNIQTRENTSIHWHGLHQRGTPWDDGPEQVSQCPIQYGMSYTYEFQLLDPGTHWYHSHHGEQWADGLWGPLIVDSNPEVYAHLYQKEVTITITDHFLETGRTIKDWYLSPVNQELGAPIPYALLINGQGFYPCAFARRQGLHCTQKSKVAAVIEVKAGLPYRVRLISASSARTLWFSIDGHRLEAIEVDGVDTRLGGHVDRVLLSSGQRISFIVNMTAGTSVAGNEFYVRVLCANADGTFPTPPPCDLNPYPEAFFNPALAILRYVYNGNDNTHDNGNGNPNTLNTPKSVVTGLQAEPVVQLRDEHILPYLHDRSRRFALAPHHFDEELVVTFEKRKSGNGSYFTTNGRKYELTTATGAGPPNLFQAFCGQPLPSASIPLYTGTGEKHVIQVVINNRHSMGHPLHFHGHSFWVIGRGADGAGEDYNAAVHGRLLGSGSASDSNVVLRDTDRFPASSWMVIRYIADNPGVWLLHCHVNWHIAAGMAAVIVEGEEAMRETLRLPAKSLELCAASGILPP